MSAIIWTRVEPGRYTTEGWEIVKNPVQSVNEFAWLLYDTTLGPNFIEIPTECFDTLAEAKAYVAERVEEAVQS